MIDATPNGGHAKPGILGNWGTAAVAIGLAAIAATVTIVFMLRDSGRAMEIWLDNVKITVASGDSFDEVLDKAIENDPELVEALV